MIRIDVVTPPGAEPITLADARTHCRVLATGSPPTHPDDGLLTAQIAAARDHAERWIGYGIVTQGMRATLDCFPSRIDLPGVNVIVTAVKYTDDAGAEQTVAPATYVVDASGGGARIVCVPGSTWPTPRAQLGAVRVEFTAGYDADKVPASITAALKLLVGDMYENREAVTTLSGVTAAVENPTVERLLFPHRIVVP